MTNSLADSTSPYLLQHADNPVHWEPWAPAALERARRDGKPIFLSVGYSACHWCHVMAHESFENDSIAAILNEHFVNIKVDREERPDLDAVYMSAVQLLTGRGGWPMSVFLTPDLEPFFAGTYWPPQQRGGMPGFPQVLHAVIDAWTNRREQVTKQAGEITAALSQSLVAASADGGMPTAVLLEQAAHSLGRMFDRHYGGFGAAPKFPHPMDLRLLLRSAQRNGRLDDLEMVVHSLACMAAGGIHDHLGGGFARYSVDERWLVPHFEKMLYDNALLAVAYLEAFLATGREEFAAVVRSTLDYLLRDMTDPAGGIWAAEDADSEGEEGKFYVWSPEEIATVLGDEQEAAVFCEAYDVTPDGNFEGHSILNLTRPLADVAKKHGLDPVPFAERMRSARARLLAARGKRVRPGTDDKVLVAWNGLAIDALARAGAALDEPRYTQAAERAATFVLAECRDPQGRLAHQWRTGKASGLAFAEDLACLAEGLVSLYEATFDERWIAEACRLADLLLGTDDSDLLAVGGFVDPETGAFFRTSPAHETLLIRQHDMLDNATPSATGMAATVLVRLAVLTGRKRYRRAAERAIAAVAPLAKRSATAASQTLLALDMVLGSIEELVIVADGESEAAHAAVKPLRFRFRPRTVMSLRRRADAAPKADAPRPLDHLFTDRPGEADAIVLYECVGGTCTAPQRLEETTTGSRPHRKSPRAGRP
jgi:uncharacterized protein YyaL (SSP411 family)